MIICRIVFSRKHRREKVVEEEINGQSFRFLFLSFPRSSVHIEVLAMRRGISFLRGGCVQPPYSGVAVTSLVKTP